MFVADVRLHNEICDTVINQKGAVKLFSMELEKKKLVRLPNIKPQFRFKWLNFISSKPQLYLRDGE